MIEVPGYTAAGGKHPIAMQHVVPRVLEGMGHWTRRGPRLRIPVEAVGARASRACGGSRVELLGVYDGRAGQERPERWRVDARSKVPGPGTDQRRRATLSPAAATARSCGAAAMR